MKIDLTGKVAVVTGGSRGLGECMAKMLAECGATLALVARDEVKLKGVAEAIRATGGKAEYFLADVTNEADVVRMAKEVEAKLGPANILINNAGTNVRKQLVDLTTEEFLSVINSSLLSTFLVSRAFVPGMKTTGYGRIINMTSMLSHISLPARTPYSSAKTALLGFIRSLALELAGDKITVNGISPGPVGTEMNHAVMNDPVANAQFLASLPVGRWGQPEEIGALACYLASEHAGFITGTDIIIDGGWTTK
jgi:NAD(P)-dependent dehydrogenase (short-subunit alcohol dehydrogenase family)